VCRPIGEREPDCFEFHPSSTCGGRGHVCRRTRHVHRLIPVPKASAYAALQSRGVSERERVSIPGARTQAVLSRSGSMLSKRIDYDSNKLEQKYMYIHGQDRDRRHEGRLANLMKSDQQSQSRTQAETERGDAGFAGCRRRTQGQLILYDGIIPNNPCRATSIALRCLCYQNVIPCLQFSRREVNYK
jgi:hypothetical protein